MNRRQAIIAAVALSMVLVLFGSVAAQMCQQKTFSYTYSTKSHPSLQVYSGIASLRAITIDEYCRFALAPSNACQAAQGSAANFTRAEIYAFIDENPGIQFRAICSALSLPVGLVQYYLNGLVKTGLISYVRDGKYKRFFVSKRFSKREMAAICLLRHKTAKRIVEVLLGKRQLSHCKLANEVSVTSQALTWQMHALNNTEFILQTNEGLKTIYFLNESSSQLLQKYLAIVQ